MKYINKRKRYLKDEKFLNVFGKRIKEVRESKKLTQEALANNINVDISQISRIERGISNASISIIKDISIVLDVELKEIFNFCYDKELTDNTES